MQQKLSAVLNNQQQLDTKNEDIRRAIEEVKKLVEGSNIGGDEVRTMWWESQTKVALEHLLHTSISPMYPTDAEIRRSIQNCLEGDSRAPADWNTFFTRSGKNCGISLAAPRVFQLPDSRIHYVAFQSSITKFQCIKRRC